MLIYLGNLMPIIVHLYSHTAAVCRIIWGGFLQQQQLVGYTWEFYGRFRNQNVLTVSIYEVAVVV